jgi:hypothetical protein
MGFNRRKLEHSAATSTVHKTTDVRTDAAGLFTVCENADFKFWAAMAAPRYSAFDGNERTQW